MYTCRTLKKKVWFGFDKLETSTGRMKRQHFRTLDVCVCVFLTSVNPSFSGLMGSLAEFPGKLIFFPSPKGLVGILCRYP